ncbi:hypothetical protein [Actinokineospora bangkokensis]|uniref:Peptidase M50 domain-containing protein n=1 Tax=Actinokineospora bangkokensis TaxID=1193682 RepID=A0A1Q9LS40_9PSEU|nr:hypothetical protein [Actinokineospora bangkokensis]OLR94823.1 hypothetical protein BJP25_09330 [Actinokineospora bangkokensis]
MPTFPPDAPVLVRPFTARRDGESAVLGDDARQVYLSVPADGLDLLEWLADGVPPAEAVRRYERRHGETPDLDGFLQVLAEEGFVAPAGGELPADPTERPRRAWNLDGLSPAAAARFFSRPVAIAAGLVVAVAAGLAVTDPGVLPGASSLAFHDHFWAYLLAVMSIATVGVGVHELAHVVAARAAGVSARISVGNQMYAMVAQTDMSGIWLAPKRQRYTALLAGMYVDVLSAAVLVIVLRADRAGLLTLAGPVRTVLAALLFTYFIRLLWQAFVFLRTDLYYVFATALGTPSLMADTGTYLRNLVRRVLRRPLVDQSGVGTRELRLIRVFSVVYVLGRALALGVLVTATIPLILFYGERVIAFFTGAPLTGSFTWADVLAFAALTFLFDLGGLVLWVRQLWRSRKARALAPHRVLVE